MATLLVVMRLTAAAFASDFSPLPYLGLPSSHVARAWLLVLVVGVLAVLVWLGNRVLRLPAKAVGYFTAMSTAVILLVIAVARLTS